MALTVEDGTGLANADSYVSLADANSYFVDRNNPAEWTGASDAAKEAALRYAARWLDGKFRWVGMLLRFSQSLGWPRIQGLAYVDAFTDEGRLINGVPQVIKDSCCELALVHIRIFPLNKAFGYDARLSSVQAGSVAVTFEHALRGPQFDYIEGLLRDYITGGGIEGAGTTELIRS